MRKSIAVFALVFAALSSGCIIIPVGGHHHGWYTESGTLEGQRGG